ncbi:hypothetical protein BSKO_11414 [Bryopsis sp. KO-2023]|nr:hypothetical protein BSKO_11414 [Bryopsis sp. KO-2023]
MKLALLGRHLRTTPALVHLSGLPDPSYSNHGFTAYHDPASQNLSPSTPLLPCYSIQGPPPPPPPQTRSIHSFSSESSLCGDDTEPPLPQHIVAGLFDLGIPSDVIKDMQANPYLASSLTKRFSQFEQFCGWVRKWGVRDGGDVGGMVVMRPLLLKASLRGMEDTVNWYRRELSIPDEEVGRIAVENPALLTFSPMELRDIFRCFENVGFARKHFRRFLLDHPALITPNIEGRLENIVDWLTGTLRLKIPKIKKVLDRAPNVLEKSNEDLNAYRDYLEQHLEMKAVKINSMVRMNPRWLGLDLERAIVPKTRYLHYEFGLSHKEVGRIVGMQPGLMVRPLQNMKTAREFLLSIGMSPDDLKFVISRVPSAFFIHAERTLMPLVKFILEVMDRSPREIVEFPYSLTYPVDMYMVRVGFLGLYAQKKVVLKQMTKPPDHIFAEVVTTSKRTKYQQFKSNWIIPKEWLQYVCVGGKDDDFEDMENQEE